MMKQVKKLHVNLPSNIEVKSDIHRLKIILSEKKENDFDIKSIDERYFRLLEGCKKSNFFNLKKLYQDETASKIIVKDELEFITKDLKPVR